MIRQAISCDICGNEKKQTNHWFVAYEQGAELRVSGWNSRNRLRPGTKHLCGQTCLHKLVDDFMAMAIGQKTQSKAQAPLERHAAPTDASLTSFTSYNDVEFESSARLIEPAAAPAPAVEKPAGELVAIAVKARNNAVIPPPEESRFTSRNWRAEAWEREREREMRSQDRRADLPRRRATGH